MSAIICFDIRNFTTHVSHHSSQDKSEIFKVIEDIFKSLERAINDSRTKIGVRRQVFVNHTGDGFVAIFWGQGKSLQSLLVASLVAIDVENLLKEYNNNNYIKNNNYLRHIAPLEYGIGINRGSLNKFKYQPTYSERFAGFSMYGFLGHALNLSNRVQESTKDHTFKIICTYPVYRDAISVINDRHRETIKKYFTKLDRHKLRGMKGHITLYGVRIDFAKKFESNMLSSFDDQEKKNENRSLK